MEKHKTKKVGKHWHTDDAVWPTFVASCSQNTMIVILESQRIRPDSDFNLNVPQQANCSLFCFFLIQ